MPEEIKPEDAGWTVAVRNYWYSQNKFDVSVSFNRYFHEDDYASAVEYFSQEVIRLKNSEHHYGYCRIDGKYDRDNLAYEKVNYLKEADKLTDEQKQTLINKQTDGLPENLLEPTSVGMFGEIVGKFTVKLNMRARLLSYYLRNLKDETPLDKEN